MHKATQEAATQFQPQYTDLRMSVRESIQMYLKVAVRNHAL